MALTEFQRTICRLIARHRIAGGESYVAGGAALGALLDLPRLSRDLDLFHDSDEALATTFESDRELLTREGYAIEVLRERASYCEARVTKGGESVLIEWARDSAFRFFPLVEHDELGLTLHPYDLATNKVLALVGRLEARDWVDLLECGRRLQALGYLAWGACAKDPGFNPRSILAEARRSARYSALELAELEFEGARPDADELAREWRAMLAEADTIVAALPPARAGTCVVGADGRLWNGPTDRIRSALETGDLRFHTGSIRGAWPRLIDPGA